jgi:ATP-binding cassette subfamily B protein
MLWVGKLILDGLVGLRAPARGNSGHLWQLVGLEFGLAVLSDVLGRNIA